MTDDGIVGHRVGEFVSTSNYWEHEGWKAIWSLIQYVDTPNSLVGGDPYVEEKKHTLAADSALYLKSSFILWNWNEVLTHVNLMLIKSFRNGDEAALISSLSFICDFEKCQEAVPLIYSCCCLDPRGYIGNNLSDSCFGNEYKKKNTCWWSRTDFPNMVYAAGIVKLLMVLYWLTKLMSQAKRRRFFLGYILTWVWNYEQNFYFLIQSQACF